MHLVHWATINNDDGSAATMYGVVDVVGLVGCTEAGVLAGHGGPAGGGDWTCWAFLWKTVGACCGWWRAIEEHVSLLL